MEKEYFFSIVDSIIPNESGCMIWPYGKTPRGYPKVKLGKTGSDRGNRHVLERKLGRKILQGMNACHSCDNPSCVNPDHIWEGTTLDNVRDKHSKGRARGVAAGKNHFLYGNGHLISGENNPRVKLTDLQVKEIRKLLAEKNMSHKKISEIYGVSKTAITNINTGKTRILST